MHLKRRHAACILSLREEFLRKRKKGKLPQDATSTLKEWWQANLVWPYPADEDKRNLGTETGLNQTQINNCAWMCVRCFDDADFGLYICRVHQYAQAPLAQGAHCAHDVAEIVENFTVQLLRMLLRSSSLAARLLRLTKLIRRVRMITCDAASSLTSRSVIRLLSAPTAPWMTRLR